MASGNKEVLNALARSAFQEADVKAVLIQDASSNRLVSLGKDNSVAPAGSRFPLLPVEAPIHRNSLEIHGSPPSPAAIGRVSLAISRDRLLIHRQETIQTSALLGFCCLLLAGILGQRISHRVSVPPLWMDEAIKEPRNNYHDIPTQEPSASGWHEVESNIEGRAKLPKTAHKQLQEKIDEATAELRETMEELEIKIVELDIARKKALQASRVKSEFLANMSHEIRTPMNGVMGFIELLSKTKLNRTQHGYLKTLWASAENLMVIINDVLDFSKIEAGKFKIRQRNFDLREAVENAVLLFAANAHYKGIKLILDIEPEVPSNLMGDASRIAQIVTNFVSNAVKFTDRGEVEVLVRKVSESAQTITFKLSVRDTGIGIALTDQKRLFNAFHQLDTSTTRRHSGTGLGLTICQRLVTIMKQVDWKWKKWASTRTNCSPPSACRRGRSRSTASNTTAASASSRPVWRWPTASRRSHRPMPARSARRTVGWAPTARAVRPAPWLILDGHSQTAAGDSGHRSVAPVELRCPDPAAPLREQERAAGPLRARRRPRRAAVRRRQPTHLAERHGPAARGAASVRPRARAARRPRRRRQAARGGVHRRGRQPPRSHGDDDRLRRVARPPRPGRQRRAARAVALRALRSHPARRAALRFAAGRLRVGGLADTVVDANEMALASSAGTGIVFSPVLRETLEIAIDRTAALWRQAMVWRRVQVRAMFTDVSWARPARRYATLYRELSRTRSPEPVKKSSRAAGMQGANDATDETYLMDRRGGSE